MQILGSGGYGQVIALDGHRVAKIQYSSKAHDPGVSTAALREMVAMTQIGELWPGRMLLDDTGTSAIEIRRFDMSLLDWIRSRPRDSRWPLVPKLMGDVVRELFAAHSRGFIHRDVKPENVMIDLSSGPIPRAHLIDWGMSRCVFEEEAGDGPWTPGQTTIWYRAPELFTGDAYGPAADMWAFGILLIEVITGKCPFRGRTELSQLQHYVDVLGPPPADRSVLPKWVFDRDETSLSEAERSELWEGSGSPSLRAFGNGIGCIIDGLIRWDPASRTAARTLSLHPLFNGGGPVRLPPPPSPPSALSLPAGTDFTLKHSIQSVIVPVCIRCNVLEGMVLWTACRFVARVIVAGGVHSRAHLGLISVACVDLSNKMVGTQSAQVLRRMRVHDAVSAQVSIVNGVLGIAGLVEQCPVSILRGLCGATSLPCWQFTRDRSNSSSPVRSLRSLHYQISRSIMDAVLILRPRTALTHLSSRRAMRCLHEMCVFAALGRGRATGSVVLGRPLVRCLIHCTNHMLTKPHSREARQWVKLHPHTSLLLRRDHAIRKRLVTAFLLADQRS